MYKLIAARDLSAEVKKETINSIDENTIQLETNENNRNSNTIYNNNDKNIREITESTDNKDNRKNSNIDNNIYKSLYVYTDVEKIIVLSIQNSSPNLILGGGVGGVYPLGSFGVPTGFPPSLSDYLPMSISGGAKR